MILGMPRESTVSNKIYKVVRQNIAGDFEHKRAGAGGCRTIMLSS